VLKRTVLKFRLRHLTKRQQALWWEHQELVFAIRNLDPRSPELVTRQREADLYKRELAALDQEILELKAELGQPR
jgi:hypothetical protein